jgi:hypothetical protein
MVVSLKGGASGAATTDELAQMADLVRGALDEGAIGFSTGLGYAPGVFADTEELVRVTAPLAERGGVYTSHARSYIALGLDKHPERPPSRLASAVAATVADIRVGTWVYAAPLHAPWLTAWPVSVAAWIAKAVRPSASVTGTIVPFIFPSAVATVSV